MTHIQQPELLPLSRKDWEQFTLRMRGLNVAQPSADHRTRMRRILHDYPQVCQGASDMASAVQQQMVQKMSTNRAAQAAVWRGIADLQYELGYHAAPPLERLLIEQIVICWLQLAQTQSSYTKLMIDATPTDRGIYWERRLTQVQNRYMRSTEALARVRRLARATPLQVNIGGQQINIVDAGSSDRY